MSSIENQYAILIVDHASHAHDAGCTARGYFVDFQGWIECITNEYRVKEPAGLLQKCFQGILHLEWKQSRTGDSLYGDLITMGEHVRQPARFAEFGIVVDGVVIPAGCLKCEEYRLCHGAAWQWKPFAQLEIIKPALLSDHAVVFGIETGVAVTHGRAARLSGV